VQKNDIYISIYVPYDENMEENHTLCAAGVTASTASSHEAGPGSTPRAVLQSIRVQPIPFTVARRIMEKHHYLHSLPGGTKLSFGVMLMNRLLGAIVFGAGPHNAYNLVSGACPKDCLTLTRFWLSDELPPNSESRVIGVCLRALRKHTSVKFLVTYADAEQGHAGTIYQATGWTYTGISEAVPLYDLGDGVERHSRSLSYCFGSHSVEYFKSRGVKMRVVPQTGKHRYIYFLDRSLQSKLKTPVLPYPGKENI
jgi:hypothetical protein